jgi:hypothetical protein
MQYKKQLLRLSCLGMFMAVLFSACEEDMATPATAVDADASATPRAVYSSRTVNWNNRTDGSYSSSEAASDFGNVGSWNESRAYNSGGTCRITLLKNALSGAGGLITDIDISDGSEYQLQFDTRFHSAFDWSRGGKVGFGFRIGDGNTGCDPAWDGNGGSLRVMWYQNDAGRTYFRPYVYHRDQPTDCGDSFGKSYPSSGSISKGTWYTIRLYAKSNTGSNTNGSVSITINGTTVHSQSIRWTTNDTKRLIRLMSFHTFRGGSTSNWQSSTDGYIYYDNLSWSRISS